jgi:hypothetical protein
MSGLGAWSFGFYHEGMSVPNARVAAGILAFKHALIDSGFAAGIDLTSGKFGHSMAKQTKAFQSHAGIQADGVIGPQTARFLLRHYSFAEEQGGTVEIPDHLLHRQGGLESGHDPVAQGFADPEDEGWAQLHLPFFPKVTVQQAWTPSFAIEKLGSHLKTFYVNSEADWDGAVASWNVGTGTAIAWVQAGKPASGDVAGGVDWYARATKYVSLVKATAY